MEILMLCLIIGIGLALISFERKLNKHLDGIEEKINQLQNTIDRTNFFQDAIDKSKNLISGTTMGGDTEPESAQYWLADEDGDIDTVSESNSRFVAPHMQLDLTAKYKVNDKFTVKAEAVNLNNREEYYYWGNPNQISQYDIYGSSYSVGFTYTI